jgi:hypothetical protein
VFAAGRIFSDGAGLHTGRPVKSGFNTVSTGFSKHLGGCITAGYRVNIDLLFFGDNFVFLPFIASLSGIIMMSSTGLIN